MVDAETIEVKKRSLYSRWLVVIGWVAMLIFAGHACTRMVAAGDTWVAMACGRHFLNHGVDTVEPFSANSHKAGPTEEEIEKWPRSAKWIADKVGLDVVKYWHPTGWVNQNWLTHVIFYWLTHESPFADAEARTFNTLVYWKFAVYILLMICVYYMGRILGVHPALCAAFACFALFTGRSYFDIRPAGFSNLLTGIFLLVLILTTYRNILYIWLIVPVAVFWCNVHGGYIYIFIMLVPFTVFGFLTSFSKKRFVSIGLKGVYHTLGAGFAAFVASIVFNPFHLTNLTHTFVISVSKHAEKWRTVNEWHPAFEWSNAVGTSFPFFVLVVMSIGLLVLWFFSRFLLPGLLKGSKSDLTAQERRFPVLLWIFGWGMAVVVCWIVFISCSFISNDWAGFFIAAIFISILLLSVCKNVHYIYLVIPLTLAAMWSAKSNSAVYSGRYFYPFVIIPMYALTGIVASVCSKRFKIKPENIGFAALTAVVSLVLMVLIFDPFKFKDSIWHLGQFMNLKRLWHPVYEQDAGGKLNQKYLFSVLYIINIASVFIWLLVPYLQELFKRFSDKANKEECMTYEKPKIDVSMIVIAGLTIYMAIRSRRFIPIAAIAMCPILAMFIEQMIFSVSAARNFYRRGRLCVGKLPESFQAFFVFAGTAAVLCLGTWWGLKFKSVYLDPWPTDDRLTSVFMRMTASHVKPFYAGEFIKGNKLSGKMFNYWTEGGFIAYAQEPDSVTGKTGLQLFMDGRAQAAYDRKAYGVWERIMGGGSTVYKAQQRGRKLTSKDYAEIGKFVDERLKKHEVWITLMPRDQFDKPFVKGLEHHEDWHLVFINNNQKIFVDITDERGRGLFDGIFNDKTFYPDEFSRDFICANNLLMMGKTHKARKEGFNRAVQAFKLQPSQATMLKIIYSARTDRDLGALVSKICKEYLEDYKKNKDVWSKEDGYFHKCAAAFNASSHLMLLSERQKNEKLAEFYKVMREGVIKEISRVQKRKKW